MQRMRWTIPTWQRASRMIPMAVLLLLLYGLIVAGVGWSAREERIAQIEESLRSRSSATAAVMTRKLEDLRRDVLFLAATPPISGIARASANGGYDLEEKSSLALWNRRLVTIFSAYAAAHPDIAQVRLIGLGQNGRELVRVDRDGDTIVSIPAKQLQEKGSTDYVQATSRLQPGDTYFSEINLNREHGKVQLPPTPVVRAATPVYGADGNVFGVVVINFRVDQLIRTMASSLPPYLSAYLTNGSGDFLMHPAPDRAFGFDLGRRWRWQDEFQTLPAAAHDRMRQIDAHGMRLYATYQTVVLDRAHRERDLRYVLINSGGQVAAAGQRAQWNSALALLVATLLMGAVFYLVHEQRRQVRAYQQRMSAIVDNSDDAIISKTLDGLVNSWNNGAQQMFGYGAADALERPLLDLIVPQGMEQEERDLMQRIGRGERVTNVSTTRRRKDGSLLSVSVSASPIHSADGLIVGAAETVRDISVQVAATKRIQEMNATLEAQVGARTREIEALAQLQRAILVNAPYAVIATDADGVIQLFNPAAQLMLGYTAAELIGHQTPAILHDKGELAQRRSALVQELDTDVAPGVGVLLARARRDLVDEREWTYVRKDGSRFPVLLTVGALRSEQGEITGFLGIASDISARDQDRRTLVAARDQLLVAANVAQLGIWSWTPGDNGLEWNEQMFELYDVPLAERGRGLNYEHWRSRVHPDDVGRVAGLLAEAVAGRAVYDTQFRIFRTDGSVCYVQAAATIERDADGFAVRVLGINRNVTLEHEAQEVLLAAKKAADDASRAKSEFLANMSHEIRSPMNAVLGMLTLLKQTPLNVAQLDYASKAESAGRALLGILNDILDFSKVEAGKLTLDPHPFSLDQLLRDAAVILTANVGEKPVEIFYQVEPGLPGWIHGDAMRIQQILINLAGNAVKFTAQGEVVLAVYRVVERGTPSDPDQLCLGFSIRDTGIGIAPEECERIFEGFSQAEASTARRFGGSGLGLAICQRLVALMDGTLTVESALGHGSIFRFQIQCQRATAPEREVRPDVARLSGIHCLVVDDHGAARAALIAMLNSFGWQADAAGSGEEALALLALHRTMPYQAIFVDWQMPGMDGWETTERIRQLPGMGDACAIIMVTAHERRMLAQREARSGSLIDGVVMKPATASALFDAVANAVGKGRQPAAQVTGQGGRARRLAGLRLLLVEDNPVNQQVARELLAGEGAIIHTVGDGQAALDALGQAALAFDGVLMDVQMPNMDGYTATRAIRAGLGMHTLPIIAMTANAMSGDRALALAAGMNDHIGKPFDLDRLVAVILQQSGRPAPAHAGTAAQDSDAPLTRAGFDGDAALVRFGGSVKIFHGALIRFVADVAAAVTAVPPILPERERAKVAAALHSLRGMAATVGASDMAAIALQMEHGLDALSQAQWAQAHARLLAASGQATVCARELVIVLEARLPLPPARAAADRALLPQALQALQKQLAASNMEALALFDALMTNYGQQVPGHFAELDSAIRQFDFKAAAQLCEAMIEKLASTPV